MSITPEAVLQLFFEDVAFAALDPVIPRAFRLQCERMWKQLQQQQQQQQQQKKKEAPKRRQRSGGTEDDDDCVNVVSSSSSSSSDSDNDGELDGVTRLVNKGWSYEQLLTIREGAISRARALRFDGEDDDDSGDVDVPEGERSVASEIEHVPFLRLEKLKQQQQAQRTHSDLWAWDLGELPSHKRASQDIDQNQPLLRRVAPNRSANPTRGDIEFALEMQCWVDAFASWLRESDDADDGDGDGDDGDVHRTRAFKLLFVLNTVPFAALSTATEQQCIDAIVGSIFCVVEKKGGEFRPKLPQRVAVEVVNVDDDTDGDE